MKEYQELARIIPRLKDLVEHRVTVMPDFFIDYIVTINVELKKFYELLNKVAQGGGGNLTVRGEIVRGGNAANIASALASLGVNVYLIVVTSRLGKVLLEYFMNGLPVNLDHVKISEQESKTIALELYFNSRKVNIMLSDPGSLKCFETSLLSDEDIRVIDQSEIIGVFNWNLNECSNNLIKELRELTSRPLFLDTSDPRVASMDRVNELLKILMNGVVDYLSLNENEIIFYANKLGYSTNDPLRAARYLYNMINVRRLYVHTPSLVAVFPDDIVVKTLEIKPIRVTGAGDTWNAGIIAGLLLNLNTRDQLILANTLAACYITRVNGKHCKLKDLIKFIEATK